MKLKKDDIVQVMTGKYKGQQGRIIKVLSDKNRVIVEGVNIIKKHERPTQENPQGGIAEREGTLHVSNVMVVHDGSPTRIGYKKLENGFKVRIASKTGEEIN